MHPLVGIKKYGLRMLKSWLRNKWIARDLGCRTDFWNVFKQHRTDTLFILGSAASINNYTEKEWNKINKGTTIGLGFWTLHDYVPDIYCFELWDTSPLPHNLNIREDDYRNTKILIKDLDNLSSINLKNHIEKIPVSLRKNTFLSLDFDYPLDTINDLKKYLNTINLLGFFNNKRFPIPRKIGTIFYVIALATKLGYKKIVLCGVDLNNPECFFDKDRSVIIEKGLVAPKPITADKHKTFDPDKFNFTIDQALYTFRETILNKKNIELYVAKTNSALYPKLPVYFSNDE